MVGGLVSVFGGAAIARLLSLSSMKGPSSVGARMCSLAAAFALASAIAAFFVPPMKRLWTAPFSLGVLAGVCVVLTLAFLLFDRRRSGALLHRDAQRHKQTSRDTPRLLWPLLALGRNSLLVYFGSMTLTATLRTLPRDGQSWAESLARQVEVGGTGPLGFVALSVAAWAVVAVVLDRAGLYVRP